MNSSIQSCPAPVADYDQQDSLFAAAFRELESAIEQRVFPGCSLAVTRDHRLIALKGMGRFTYSPDSPEVTSSTIFDLASVTKGVATATSAMILYERGRLLLETPVVAILPEFAGEGDPRRKQVTVRMLLAHASGLPAYEKLFLQARTKEQLLRAALTTPLMAEPGAHVEYSDLGFIILGALLHALAGEPLDDFCRREIFIPLGMAHSAYTPPVAWRELIPPTTDDRTFRHRIIQGEVHDENASVMGGVSGHAGLFSNAHDLARFAQAMLDGGAPLVRQQTLAMFTRREPSPPRTSRTLGWDTPFPPSQSGKYFSERSFGHLGYTGTSLWIDVARQVSITLLTNRTWPDRTDEAIKLLRPRFYNACMEAMGFGR